MTGLYSRLDKQFDVAAKRFRNTGAVWSVQIAKK